MNAPKKTAIQLIDEVMEELSSESTVSDDSSKVERTRSPKEQLIELKRTGIVRIVEDPRELKPKELIGGQLLVMVRKNPTLEKNAELHDPKNRELIEFLNGLRVGLHVILNNELALGGKHAGKTKKDMLESFYKSIKNIEEFFRYSEYIEKNF